MAASAVVGAPAAGAPAGVGASPIDPSRWTAPQKLARTGRVGLQEGRIGLATTPNGKRAALIMEASPRGSRQNDVARAYEWSRGRWTSRGPIPGGGHEADDVVVQWAKSDGRALAFWRGESDEGATDVRASVRDGGAWTTAYDPGKGVPAGRIALDGSRALLAWYAEDAEEASSLAVRSAWWVDGDWQAATTHGPTGTTITPLDLDGTPLVAVSADGARAVLVWSRDDALWAAWWNGAWSAPMPGPAGVSQRAVALDATATSASIIATRAVGTAVEFSRIALSPAGFGASSPLGSVDVGGPATYALRNVEVNADGSAVLALLTRGGILPSLVALWPAGVTTPVVTDLGTASATDAVLPAKGPYAFIVVRPDPSAATVKDKVMAWTGSAWQRIAKVRVCGEAEPVLAVSARGTTKVLAWMCGSSVLVSRTSGR